MELGRRSVLRGLGLVGAGGVGAVGYDGFGSGRASTAVRALVAGSLLALATEVPGASVEAHGSVAVRRLILDGLREPDAVALADPRLFAGLSERVTLFATNALVLAYAPGSGYADALESDWRDAIERPGIDLGRTDPAQDPLGYRTVMALRLAAREYGVDAGSALEASTVLPETDLLHVLEAGRLDAAFAYRNMAVQRDLPYVELPDAVDFSNPSLAETYATVGYDVGGETVRGAPIRYAAAAFSDDGEPWVRRLVSARARLRAAGFLVPPDYPRAGHRVPGTA